MSWIVLLIFKVLLSYFIFFAKTFVFCGLTLIPSAFSSHRISCLGVWQSLACWLPRCKGPWLGLLCVVSSAVGHQDRSLQSPPARQSHHLISLTATPTHHLPPLLSSPVPTSNISRDTRDETTQTGLSALYFRERSELW